MNNTENLARELCEIFCEKPTLIPGWTHNDWLRVAAHVEAMQKPLREALEKFDLARKNCPRIEGCCGFDAAQQELVELRRDKERLESLFNLNGHVRIVHTYDEGETEDYVLNREHLDACREGWEKDVSLEYWYLLFELVNGVNPGQLKLTMTLDKCWIAVCRATPEQRCRAWLAFVKERK